LQREPVIVSLMTRSSLRRFLGPLLTLSVTLCLNSGISSAAAAKTSEHSCCPGQSQPAQAPTRVGGPGCCLALTPAKAALPELTLHAVAGAPFAVAVKPVFTHIQAPSEPLPNLLLQVLSHTVVATRAPPHA